MVYSNLFEGHLDESREIDIGRYSLWYGKIYLTIRLLTKQDVKETEFFAECRWQTAWLPHHEKIVIMITYYL